MNRKFKKALSHFANGHSISDIAIFLDTDNKDILNMFKEHNIETDVDARKELAKIKESEEKDGILKGTTKNESRDVPEFIPPKTNYSHNLKNFKTDVTFEDIVPMAEQQAFRKDLKTLSWSAFSKKWTERLGISNSRLVEQVKALSPTTYSKIFMTKPIVTKKEPGNA